MARPARGASLLGGRDDRPHRKRRVRPRSPRGQMVRQNAMRSRLRGRTSRNCLPTTLPARAAPSPGQDSCAEPQLSASLLARWPVSSRVTETTRQRRVSCSSTLSFVSRCSSRRFARRPVAKVCSPLGAAVPGALRHAWARVGRPAAGHRRNIRARAVDLSGAGGGPRHRGRRRAGRLADWLRASDKA